MSSDVQLPAGWAMTTIGEVTDSSVEQIRPDGNDTFVYVDISSIDRATKAIADAKVLPVAKAPTRARQRLRFNDVVVSMTRPNLNAVALVQRELDGATGSTGFHVLRTAHVNPAWLLYLVQTYEFIKAMSSLVLGVLYPAVRPKDIAGFQVALPPVKEQDRIVSEIKKQFTRLDAAVAALKRVQANLERYRATLLKAACEGRLVPSEAELARKEGRSYEAADQLLARILQERRAKWEAGQLARMLAAGKPPKGDSWKRKYKEPEPPEARNLAELPEGWAWASLEQLAWDADYGTSEKCDYNAPGLPVLRIPNIVADKVSFKDLKFATSTATAEPSVVLNAGDFLIIRTNGSRDLIGRAALLYQAFERPHLHASYLIRYRLMPAVMRWVAALWNTAFVRSQIEQMAATSAGQYNVSVNKLNRLVLPVSPSEEQARMIGEIERQASEIAAVEEITEQNLLRADRLRHAILKRAFEGKLVPQDRNDEPASALLDRIRSERATDRPGPGLRPKHDRRLSVQKEHPKTRQPIVTVLENAKEPMSPEELFAAAGYSVETVDEFYSELKTEVTHRRIEEERSGNRHIVLRIGRP